MRKLSMTGFDLIAGSHNIYALLDFDITGLRTELRAQRQQNRGGSLFAFVLKAIGMSLARYPEFNSIIDYRRTTEFGEVDICIPLEIEHDGRLQTKQHIVRTITAKSTAEITEEIAASKANQTGEAGYVFSRPLQHLLTRIPRRLVVFFYRYILRNHERIKRLSGTTFVTSVSMLSNTPGYVIPYAGGPKACSFAIGGAEKRPVVRGEQIVIREMLNITAVFNHDIIDGAPAARFIQQLKRYIEIDRGEVF